MGPASRAPFAAILVVAALCAAGCASAGPGGGSLDGGGGGDDDVIDGGGPGVIDADPGLVIDAGGGVIDATPMSPPDAAPACSPCQLVSQCGCAMDQACDLGSQGAPPSGATTCRFVTAQGMSTSTCNGSTGCAAGYVCLGGAGTSSCMRYCASDAQCAGGGGLCAVGVVSGTTPIPLQEVPGTNVHVCSQSCDPLSAAPAGCPATWGCQVSRNADQARNFTVCDKAGASGQNGSCAGGTGCQAGFVCLTTNLCKKYCNVNNPGTACNGTGGTCASLTIDGMPATVAGITYGVCN